MVDASGQIVSQSRYLPFGELLWENGCKRPPFSLDKVAQHPCSVAERGTSPTDYTYTGQRSLSDIGLMDYNARFYDPMLGRFTSPDSIVPDPGSVIGYNRYAYVANNPMIYTDPSGHCYTSSGAYIPGGGEGDCSFRTSIEETNETEISSNPGVTGNSDSSTSCTGSSCFDPGRHSDSLAADGYYYDPEAPSNIFYYENGYAVQTGIENTFFVTNLYMMIGTDVIILIFTPAFSIANIPGLVTELGIIVVADIVAAVYGQNQYQEIATAIGKAGYRPEGQAEMPDVRVDVYGEVYRLERIGNDYTRVYTGQSMILAENLTTNQQFYALVPKIYTIEALKVLQNEMDEAYPKGWIPDGV